MSITNVTMLSKQEYGKLRKAYYNMKARCFLPANPSYKSYGGRGITVCDLWLNGDKNAKGIDYFILWSVENGYKLGLSIDRIDVNGNYSPENCRWVTSECQDNNKRNCRMLTGKGKTQSITQWSRELGISTGCILNRLKKGWSDEEALFTPRAYFGVTKDKIQSVMNAAEKKYYSK